MRNLVSCRRHQSAKQQGSRLVLVLTTVIALLFTTVEGAQAQPTPAPEAEVDEAQATRAHPTPTIETLRLACTSDFVDGERGVVCQWSEATNQRTRAYQLVRITEGAARELVTTVGVNGRLGYFDTDVSAPSSLVYGVIAVNRTGRLVGRSAPVTVAFGQELEELRLACAADSMNGERGVLCQWSGTQQVDARGYLVYRIADSDHRRVIASVGIGGRNGHFDVDVSPGTTYTYGVVSVDGAGAALAVGGPQVVNWPAAN